MNKKANFFVIILANNEMEISLLFDSICSKFSSSDYFTKTIHSKIEFYSYLKCIHLKSNFKYTSFLKLSNKIVTLCNNLHKKNQINVKVIPCYLNAQSLIAYYTHFEQHYIPVKKIYLYSECICIHNEYLFSNYTNPVFKQSIVTTFMRDIQRISNKK